MIKFTEQEKQDIFDLYKSGLNGKQIAEKLGLKYFQPIYNVLEKHPDYVPYSNGRNHIRKYTLNEDYFSVIDTEEKAYIIGFIAADGHVDETTKRLKITLATKDKDILEKIRICLDSNTNIKDFEKKSHFIYGKPLFYHSTIEFCSSKLVADLVKIGLVTNKTYSLDQELIKFIPENLVRHFLRGYFDGDGHVSYGNKYSSGVKYNIEVVGNLPFLEASFYTYFPTTNKKFYHTRSKQTWAYKISSKQRVDDFLTYMYKDSVIYLNRKYEVYKKNVLM
jgi:intein/homing endonuclease